MQNFVIKMKLFQKSQEYFKNMGIDSRQMSKSHLLNTRNVQAFCMIFLDVVSTMGFLWYDAHTFYEYADSVYTTSCGIMSIVIFSVIFWKMRKFFEFIETFENLVSSSELSLKHSKIGM